MEARGRLFNLRILASERQNQRLVPGRAQEPDQILAGEAGSPRVDQRMKIESRVAHHRLIERDGDPHGPVVDCAKWRHRAWPDAPDFLEQLRRAKGHAPLSADLLMDLLEIDGRLFVQDEEEEAALLVLDEQVLGVASRNVAAQRLRFLYRMERRMLDGRGFYRQPGQGGEQIFWRYGHRSSDGRREGLVAARNAPGNPRASAGRVVIRAPAGTAHLLARCRLTKAMEYDDENNIVSGPFLIDSKCFHVCSS